MHVLFSGEGPTDCGTCEMNTPTCEADRFEYGPIVVMVDHLIQARLKFSIIEHRTFSCVSKHHLVVRAAKLKSRKAIQLPGRKAPKETRYFYRNARVLARCSKELEEKLGDEVVAVLFRDCDGTASAERGLWQDKWNSMIGGFEAEGFARGVPVIPKPKSEAWVICAVKPNAYVNCVVLEAESGNDNSPNPLKSQLAAICGGEAPSRSGLVQMVTDRQIDCARIDMPSFNAFRARLEEAVAGNGA